MKLDDFLVAHGPHQFQKLVTGARSFLQTASIIIDPGNIRVISEKSWDLIREKNIKSPQIFLFGNQLAVLLSDKKRKTYSVQFLDNYRLRHRLIRWGCWCYFKGDKLRPYVHSITVLEDILATPDPDVSCLEGITTVPVFSAGGELITTPGYSEKTELFYCPPVNLSLPDIPANPSVADLRKAIDIILNDIFVDFPFVGAAELSHAIALFILPFVRNLIDGPTPLHIIEKSTAGTGASLLIRAISYIYSGADMIVLPEGRDGEEWRKRMTSALRSSPWCLVIDNLTKVLDSSALAIALTTTCWEDRLLGQSQNLRIPIRCVWVATGNNPVTSYEIARRSIRIRLDARVEAPHLRDPSQFKHPSLIPWVKANRGMLIGAVLTIVQYWVAHGKPESQKSLGGFERWAAVMGGILECVGIDGFLDNTREFHEEIQTDQEQRKVFVAEWFKKYGDRDIRAGDLLMVPGIYDVVPDAGQIAADRSVKTRLGFFIKRLKDQVFELDMPTGLVTVVVKQSKRKIENSTAWKLEVVERKLKVRLKKGEVRDVREDLRAAEEYRKKKFPAFYSKR